jgi:hypothetical protein
MLWTLEFGYYLVIGAWKLVLECLKEGVVIVIWIMDHPAMYHGGYMAALNHAGFRAIALNLTWFRAQSILEPEINQRR